MQREGLQFFEGDVSVNAIIKDETIWLTQKAMAELFGVQVPAISKHLKNIFTEGKLDEKMVVSKMEITTPHGAIKGKTQSADTNFYNLDAIISVGYRINSRRATQFRIWATNILKEYIAEYTEFNKTQRIESDFDKEVKKLIGSACNH